NALSEVQREIASVRLGTGQPVAHDAVAYDQNWLGEGPSVRASAIPVSRPFSGRSPAVLPQNDPTIRALARPSRSAFGDRGDSVFKTAKPGVEQSENDKVDEKEQWENRQDFEEELSDLASRQKPYTFKDYMDYRDFVAQQSGAL